MRLQVVVQHDPRRAELLPPLVASLGADAQVVEDPGAALPARSPWRCYRACLESLEPRTSHLVVIQDDAIVCPDFPAVLERVVAARPDQPLLLFVPGVGRTMKRVLEACWAGERWAEWDRADWLPAVAVVWPREYVARILTFTAQKPPPPSKTADDGILGEWAREERVSVLATVPSLCEHPDREPSLVGTAHFGGVNPQRIAACWMGEELSPLTLQWD